MPVPVPGARAHQHHHVAVLVGVDADAVRRQQGFRIEVHVGIVRVGRGADAQDIPQRGVMNRLGLHGVRAGEVRGKVAGTENPRGGARRAFPAVGELHLSHGHAVCPEQVGGQVQLPHSVGVGQVKLQRPGAPAPPQSAQRLTAAHVVQPVPLIRRGRRAVRRQLEPQRGGAGSLLFREGGGHRVGQADLFKRRQIELAQRENAPGGQGDSAARGKSDARQLSRVPREPRKIDPAGVAVILIGQSDRRIQHNQQVTAGAVGGDAAQVKVIVAVPAGRRGQLQRKARRRVA